MRVATSMGAHVALVLALVTAACDGSVCAPGATQRCVCTDGREGAQACAAGGTAFEPCVCTGGLDGGADDGGRSDSLEIAFPPGASERHCAGRAVSSDRVVLDGGEHRDAVVVCAALVDARAVATVVVFDSYGRIAWAPTAPVDGTLSVDARSTAIGSVFLAPFFATAQPARAQVVLDEIRSSPYVDRAAGAYEEGEDAFVAAASELAEDTARRLSRDALVAEPDAVTQVRVEAGVLRVVLREGVGADVLCEAHRVSEPAACSEADVDTWSASTPARRGGRVSSARGAPRARIPARAWSRRVDLPELLLGALSANGTTEESADFPLPGPGAYQVVCAAGGFAGDLARDVTFASTVVAENGPAASPWSLHRDATHLNLLAVFFDTLSIVIGDLVSGAGSEIASAIAEAALDLLAETARLLDQELRRYAASSLAELPSFSARADVVTAVLGGIGRWLFDRLVSEAIRSARLWRALVGRAGTILTGAFELADRIASAGEAIERLWALSVTVPAFDWFYVGHELAGCPPSCGDGACDGAESCSSCPADCDPCPPSCGDGACNGTESCSSCPADCDPCPPSCGDGACNGTESCSSCPADCDPCPPSCGDGACNGTESCSSCPADCDPCPPSCGDGACNGAESCSSCPADCGCGSGSVCQSGACVSCGARTQPCCASSTCGGSLVCAGGACRDCAPSSTSCSGGTLVTCASDGYSSTTSACPTGACASATACQACASNYCADRGLTSGLYCDGADRVQCGSSGGCGVVTSRMTCTVGCTGSGVCTCGANYCSASGHASGTWCDGSDRVTCTMGPGGCLEELSRMTCPSGCSAGACTTCTTAYGPQGFESLSLFSESITGSQTFSDGTEFFDAGGGSYLRYTTSAHGGTYAMNLYTASSGSAGNTTLAFPAPASSGERLRVSFWVYNPFVSSYTIELVRAGGTPVAVSIPGGDWYLVSRDVTSTLSTSQLVVRLGLIPNGGGGWTFRMDDLLIERCP